MHIYNHSEIVTYLHTYRCIKCIHTYKNNYNQLCRQISLYLPMILRSKAFGKYLYLPIYNYFSIYLLNTQSLNNKADTINSVITNDYIDIFCLIEIFHNN